MINKTILLFGILGLVALPLIMAKPSPPQEEIWIWDQARWDLNKWF